MKRQLPFHSNAVWPPAWLMVTFLFAYGLVMGCLWLISVRLPNAGDISNAGEIVNIRMTIIGGAAALYAAFRLFRFHPACNHAYANWLRLSPWTPRKPLPLGPVHFVWQDAAVIGVLSAIAFWHAHVDPLLPVEIFALAYFGIFTLLLLYMRRWWTSLALGFLWPALTLPQARGTAGVIIAVAIIVVIGHGHWQSLKAFPWPFLKGAAHQTPLLQRNIQIDLGGNSLTRAQAELGWPFFALSPKTELPSVSQRNSVCLGALFGWWSFCFTESATPGPLPELIVFFAFIAGMFRFAIYGNKVSPPFNVWWRIASGRILVPGFDIIFLTPLATVLVAIVGGMIIKRSGSWYPEVEAGVIAVMWYLLFGGGPTLRKWMLTGQFRLRPPARINANKQQLREV